MRLVLLAQVAIAAVLAASCSGADSADPSGGTSGAGNSSGQGGEGNGSSSGQGGAGNGSGQGGAGNGSSTGQGGAGNGSSTGQGGAGNGGVGGNIGEPSTGTGAGGSLNEVCAMVKSDLDLKYVDAAACNPLSDTPQCKDTVSGPCSCQIVVALKNTPAVIAYLDAVKAWQSAGCDATCPPDPCPPMPTGVCTPQGAPNVGICVTQP